MTELFTMQRYLQPQRLKRAGLSYFDAWAAAFCKTTTALELTSEGKGFRSKTRMVDVFAERAENICKRKVEPDEDNMLLVTNDGRKLALE